ncbi:hypothetical protein [Sphingomonas sp. 22R3R2A-7]|uniref:hypothetical protein n=1 Tax=Sphingomonas sp. 22R3R2A-7 TaxID=3050230 RepID=UPI002FE33991
MFGLRAVLDRAEDDLAHPDRRLKDRGDGEEEVDRGRDLAGSGGIAVDQLCGEHDDEEVAGPRDRLADDDPPAVECAGPFAQPAAETPGGVEREDDQRPRAERDQDLQPIGLDPGNAGGNEFLRLVADIAGVEDRGFGNAVGGGHRDTRQAAMAMVAGVPASRNAIRPHSSRLR